MSQSVSNTKLKLRAERSLEERLTAHPQLLSRIEALLNVVENSAGDIEQADLAEQRVIEEVRQLARSLGEETLSEGVSFRAPGSLVKLDNKRFLAGQNFNIKSK